jgi:hypothetical protein
MANKINETSEFTIPLKNLLGLIGFTAIAVWAYFGITERITFLEHNYEMVKQDLDEHDKWISDFRPPPEVQDAISRVRALELHIKVLETKLEAVINK